MPSFILALDTAHQRCSAALLSRDGEVSAWKSETVGNKHAERILAMIDELLAECVILADGVNSLLAQSIGLLPKYHAHQYAVALKKPLASLSRSSMTALV